MRKDLHNHRAVSCWTSIYSYIYIISHILLISNNIQRITNNISHITYHIYVSAYASCMYTPTSIHPTVLSSTHWQIHTTHYMHHEIINQTIALKLSDELVVQYNNTDNIIVLTPAHTPIGLLLTPADTPIGLYY